MPPRGVNVCTNQGEGIDGVPIAVPLVHYDSLRCDARGAELFRDVCGEVVEPWGPISSCNVEVLFLARDLRE